MTFSDRYLQSLKPKEKMYQVRESHGFGLRVLPSGVKIFIYVYTLTGKRRQMNLGHYPHLSLADARKAYREAANVVADGLDPQAKQPSPEMPPEQFTVSALAKQWLRRLLKVHGALIATATQSSRSQNYKRELPRRVASAWLQSM